MRNLLLTQAHVSYALTPHGYHMKPQTNRPALILLNMGGPDSLEAIEPFLYNLFSDRDLIQLPAGSLLQKPFARLICPFSRQAGAGKLPPHRRQIPLAVLDPSPGRRDRCAPRQAVAPRRRACATGIPRAEETLRELVRRGSSRPWSFPCIPIIPAPQPAAASRISAGRREDPSPAAVRRHRAVVRLARRTSTPWPDASVRAWKSSMS